MRISRELEVVWRVKVVLVGEVEQEAQVSNQVKSHRSRNETLERIRNLQGEQVVGR
jgi:hypothetical protein